MGIQLDLFISLLSIIAIDILLGGDNAVVIALASRNLPEADRTRAILYGTGLAIVLRGILTILVVYLLKVPFLLLAGGILLTFISFQLLIEKPEQPEVEAGKTTIAAVRTIVFADLIMGLDNMVAVAGAAEGHIILIIIGFLISVPVIIWGSKSILVMLERWPSLIYVGGAILAFTAARMLSDTPQLRSVFERFPYGLYGFWMLIPLIVLTISWIVNRYRKG